MPDLLLEIGCEEIPAGMIEDASDQLGIDVLDLLVRERLYGPGERRVRTYWTPRRMAVFARDIADRQSDEEDQVTGPSVKVAFKDGVPTAAAHAFAKKVNLDVSQLEKVATPKGEYMVAKVRHRGRPAYEILAEMLPHELTGIRWPKTMRWHCNGERFVRPIRWLVALLDRKVVSLNFAGVEAGAESRGNRTLGNSVVIPFASEYERTLEAAGVLVEPEVRSLRIRKDLDAATRTVPGARWREDKTLLKTVVNLTEFPSVVLGGFDGEFLELPEEVLVTVMRDHQKYFAVEDAGGKLLPHFLAVLNTDGDPRGIIRHGHERVLRARFNDARFFWHTDQKHPLRERTAWLKSVTFQKDLGTYYEKTKRVQRLCSWLCEIIRHSGMQVRPGIVHKAASLAKTDLTTELVKEFTELQGIVGGLYASVQELDSGMPDATRQAIAQAIYDHYKPESTEDAVPRSIEGAVLSIADKADSIAGMFALGLQPTGSKDPFALRRQANGIVKTIAEKKLPLSLTELFADAREVYRGSAAERKFSGDVDYVAAVRTFFRERLEFHLRDVLGFKYDVVNAVLAAGSDDIVDVIARAEAVTKVRPSADFESISIAFKRIKNILRQAGETRSRVAPAIDVDALQETVEKELAAQIPRTAEVVDALRIKRNYEDALVEISKLRPIVDRFFDKVMVMVDDERVRANRLALLQSLLLEFSTIADFSEIVTEGKESKESSKH
jgi:glycyl-tRNA synthetase beta chain